MKFQIVFLAVAALFFAGCGKQNRNNSGSTRINRYSSNQIIPSTTTCSQNAWGKIYDNAVDDASYRNRIIDFTLKSPEEVGNISGSYNSNTEVTFSMTLNFQGGFLTGSSRITFKIADSYTVEQNGGYIQFIMNGVGGQSLGAGRFDAQIGDTKGYVRLIGQKTMDQGQQVYVGKAYYNNNSAMDQYLGEFVAPACMVVGI